uniref:G-protein coupled receptors family 1 profile domain-containing protein n=1 Tax=Sinocyclocheilus anshuiensis TaxID=1608454 RepID=A0A671KG85_9TELE
MQNHSDSSLNSTSWTTANLVSSGLMGLCFMIGVPGNIAVIFFIVRHFKMDNFTVHLMLNLAAADILCLITLPVWIYNQLYSWSIGQSSCKFFAALIYCSAYSSVITVTLLSVYRCLQIRHPQLWSRVSKRRERALLISGWAPALLFSCPSVLAQEIEYRLTAAILEMLLAFFLPFTIILTSYCCLHRKVTQGTFSHRQRLTKLVTRIVVTFFIFYAPHQIINFKRRERALLISGWALALLFSCPGVLTQEIVQVESKMECERILESEAILIVALLESLLGFFLPFTIMLTSYYCLYKTATQGAFRHRHRPTKLVTRIVIVFLIFWAPHQIIKLEEICAAFLGSEPVLSLIGDIAGILTFINSCVNPFLYAFSSKKTTELSNPLANTNSWEITSSIKINKLANILAYKYFCRE